ncbi:hypothetical protein CC78DRAFT_621024 [Lojkania enalia]|uniref:Uncharacterized protein n=1 Tax=Lojkania enalia TaxID=147567 RepID=A0A9P4K0Y9_9PLEO|nr:hypothetical protein CC78DRAFT_621024 [Didymosphaeria enalia]
MLLTGILLAPTVLSDALTDLQNLHAIVNNSSQIIGQATNSSRNWGDPFGGTDADLSTAGLVQNITATVLKSKWSLDTDQVTWTNATNTTHSGTNLTNLDAPYIDYVSAIPNLAAALTALGQSWHGELNKPVFDAIGGLQDSITAFQTSLLKAHLLTTSATLRTIRASTALEDAQIAWSRVLNLPGPSSTHDTPKARLRGLPVEKSGGKGREKRGKGERFFTHQELWDERHHEQSRSARTIHTSATMVPQDYQQSAQRVEFSGA